MNQSARVIDRLEQAMECRKVTVKRLEALLAARGQQPAHIDGPFAGGSASTIYGYFRKAHTPKVDFIEAAADVLRVRYDWLVSGTGRMTEEAHAAWKHARGSEAPQPLYDQIEIAEVLSELDPAGAEMDHYWERIDAVGRFVRSLDDAGVFALRHTEAQTDEDWTRAERDRADLLGDAARFLVGVERAYHASTQRGGGPLVDREPIGELVGASLPSSQSLGARVAWRDAILGLFARRVKGLGERDGSEMDAHGPTALESAEARRRAETGDHERALEDDREWDRSTASFYEQPLEESPAAGTRRRRGKRGKRVQRAP